MNSIIVLFNTDTTEVLMQKLHNGKIDFIGRATKVQSEDAMDAAYDYLFANTGLQPKEIDLLFVRQELVRSDAIEKTSKNGIWNHISTGILKDDIVLEIAGKDFVWVNMYDFKERLQDMNEFGRCLIYLLESIEVLKQKGNVVEFKLWENM